MLLIKWSGTLSFAHKPCSEGLVSEDIFGAVFLK
jgi:hypothetical protein